MTARPKISAPLRVGIIGSGWVASERHLWAYRRDPRVRVVAIIDRNLCRARAVAERFGVPEVYQTVGENRPELDVVSICTQPQSHCNAALAALDRGWHVLVEKPMALTVDEVDLMTSAAEREKLGLGVVHNLLFSHSMIRAKRLADQGRAGKILSVDSLQTISLKGSLPVWFKKLPGGLFFNEAPHVVYLMRFFLGNPACVAAHAEHWDSDLQPVKNLAAMFQAANGNGYLNMSFNADRNENLMRIVGEKAILSISLQKDTLVVIDHDPGYAPRADLSSSARQLGQEARELLVSGARCATKRMLFGHDVLIKRFIDSVLTGSPPPVTPLDGRENIDSIWEIIDKAGL